MSQPTTTKTIKTTMIENNTITEVTSTTTITYEEGTATTPATKTTTTTTTTKVTAPKTYQTRAGHKYNETHVTTTTTTEQSYYSPTSLEPNVSDEEIAEERYYEGGFNTPAK